jgi:CRISPR-associated endonuclease/helicase Cas3
VDPFAGIAALAAQVFRWFPQALAPQAAPLPAAAEFQHAFSGLVTLADWLGSDRDIFPFRREEDPPERMAWSRAQARLTLTRMGVDTRAARQVLGPRAPTFEEFFALQPRAAQALTTQLPVDPHGGITVLEAETGSGKTEAALARFITLFHAGAVDGLYFALPTRTAATQIHTRVVRALERLFPSAEERPPAVLASVPPRTRGSTQGHGSPRQPAHSSPAHAGIDPSRKKVMCLRRVQGPGAVLPVLQGLLSAKRRQSSLFRGLLQHRLGFCCSVAQ